MSTETTDLHFHATIESFRSWLYALHHKDRDVRYSNLLAGLKLLNTAKPEPQFHFQALVEASVSVFKAASELSQVVIDKPFPLSMAHRKLARLGTQFHGELVRGFVRMAEEEDFASGFTRDEQALAVHTALKSLNRMFMGMALIYESPPSSHWLLNNELFRWAEKRHMLDWQTDCFSFMPNQSVSVRDLFLSSLTLRIVSPYRLKRSEMVEVFGFIQQEIRSVQIEEQALMTNATPSDYAVNLDNSSIPVRLAWLPKITTGDWRHIQFKALRTKLEAVGRQLSQKDMPPPLRKYLMVRLGAKLRPLAGKKPRSSLLVSGFKELVKTLPTVGTHFNSLGVLGELKLLSVGEEPVPFEGPLISKSSGTFDYYNQGMQVSQDCTKEKLNFDHLGSMCKVFLADTPGYLVVTPLSAPLPTDTLAGLFTDDKSIQFGILYHDGGSSDPTTYGMELLAMGVELARVSFDLNPKKLFQCFCASLPGNRAILITPHLRIKVGESLTLDRQGYGEKKERFVIVKQLMKHEDFGQFELALETSKTANV